MMEITITELGEHHVEVDIDGNTYDLQEDPYTGDWAVSDRSKKYPQPYYVRTWDDAIKYALREAGVLEDVSVTSAPDRTSA